MTNTKLSIAARKAAQALERFEQALADDVEARQTTSMVRQFVKNRCQRTRRGFISVAKLHGAYTTWCKQRGIEPVDKNLFGRRLTALGIGCGRRYHPTRGVVRVRTGVTLKPLPEADLSGTIYANQRRTGPSGASSYRSCAQLDSRPGTEAKNRLKVNRL